LIAGVFIMFYTSHRRVWAWISTDAPDHTEVIFAGTGNRHQAEFEREFGVLKAALERRLLHSSKSEP
jgi:cytochrome c biogenesis protein